MFENINNGKLLPEMIADEMIKLIVDDKLQAGDKLPSEAELTKKLNVGRSTLREAIKILISKNIIVIRRGLGTYVSDKMGVIDDPLGFVLVKDKKKLLLDILDVRSMIEPNIAAMAAKMATHQEIESMITLCDEVETLILNKQDHITKDVELHTQIAKSSQNLVIYKLLPIINGSIPLFIDVTGNALKNETINTHREIVNAIKAHDGKSAYDAMTRHINYNKQLIEKIKI